MLVFYYCIGKKQHILASLRKAERNIFVPSGLAMGVFEELPLVSESLTANRAAKTRRCKTYCGCPQASPVKRLYRRGSDLHKMLTIRA